MSALDCSCLRCRAAASLHHNTACGHIGSDKNTCPVSDSLMFRCCPRLALVCLLKGSHLHMLETGVGVRLRHMLKAQVCQQGCSQEGERV